MLHHHYGELAALFTACCWTCTAIVFERASIRIGSLSVNILRLFLAIFFLALFNYFYRGHLFPDDANLNNWIWLSISGLIGFVIGDLLLFQAFVVVGVRVSMLIMSLVPPITAIIGWLVLGEVMSIMSLVGMLLVLSGIAIVILERTEPGKEKYMMGLVRLKYSLPGILLALGGALGQAVGLVTSKFGMKDYDPFASTQIRVFAGFIGFFILFLILKKWHRIITGLADRKAMLLLLTGTVFGPFLGVSFSLIAVKNTSTGIASTLMSVVPVLIIIPSIILFHEKLKWKEIAGAILAVSGIALFFI
ncbi:MAG: DMT family transporter [Bacteroidia bacterium]|nr:DMT family transporter [Bacteroidia bacterium]